jgi:hypothetical protein
MAVLAIPLTEENTPRYAVWVPTTYDKQEHPYIKARLYYTKSGVIDEEEDDMCAQDWEAICTKITFVGKNGNKIADPKTWRPADGGVRNMADRPKNDCSPMGKKQKRG